MALSDALHASLSPPTASLHQPSKLGCLRLNWKQKRLAFLTSHKRKGQWIIKSIVGNKKSSINDNGATEPARILLERFFAQTQKLEEQIGKDSCLPQVSEIGLNLSKLESDLHAALEVLKNKEEDLQDAERKVLLEYHEINQAKVELERRNEEIAAAFSKHEKLEDELRLANLSLASQETEIEDLKLRLKEGDQVISAARSSLYLKEGEKDELKNELIKKIAEAAHTESKLRSKTQLLNDANAVVKKQELELQEIRKAIQEKEEELEVSVRMGKIEEEKRKVAEANLGKQTMDWLVAQEELKKLAEETSKYIGEANETMEDFRRVKKLLVDIRSELVSSQKALVLSRQKMEDQEQLLEKQLIELEKQKKSVMSYGTSLRDAQIELESERVKLRAAEARNKEFEQDLSMEKELIEELQGQLNKERSSLQQAIQEMDSLQRELDQKSIEFGETQNLLQVKESELVEARLEIQQLKSEQASFRLILEEKDLELFNATKMLQEVNKERAELRVLMKSREEQLIQATTMLKEKDTYVETMQHELNDTKLKFSEAESVVEGIVELTNKLVISLKDEYNGTISPFDEMDHELPSQLLEKPADTFKWQKKQLETELEFTRKSLRTKEMEALEAQMALIIKEEELKMVLGKLDAREKELKKMKEEMGPETDDLSTLYALAKERIGEKSFGDLAIEKLQLEAAQLEVEAATSALHKLTEVSRALLNNASLSIETDYDNILLNTGTGTGVCLDEGFGKVRTEVSRLSDLTEQLVKETGIVGDVN